MAELNGTRGLESRSEATRVGITRSLPASVGLNDMKVRVWGGIPYVAGGGILETSSGHLTWTSGFESEGAGAIRLLLEDVRLPAGTVGFVYNADGETHGPYDLGAAAAREIWTNAVFSDVVFLDDSDSCRFDWRRRDQFQRFDGDPHGA